MNLVSKPLLSGFVQNKVKVYKRLRYSLYSSVPSIWSSLFLPLFNFALRWLFSVFSYSTQILPWILIASQTMMLKPHFTRHAFKYSVAQGGAKPNFPGVPCCLSHCFWQEPGSPQHTWSVREAEEASPDPNFWWLGWYSFALHSL